MPTQDVPRTGPEILVAGVDAPAAIRSIAQYICPGSDDQAEINKALLALPSTGGTIRLVGTFTLSAQIARAIDNVSIKGDGAGTQINFNASTAVISAGSQAGWDISGLNTDAGGVDISSASESNVNYWLSDVWIHQKSVASGDLVSITKVIDHAALTDGGDATAFEDFDDTIPAGSIIKAVKVDFTEVWNSDVTSTLTMMIGIPTDLDDFNLTADPGEPAFNHTTDAFWGEVGCQDPVVVAAVIPRVTFTEDSDGTSIISGANATGGVTITITYMKA